MSTSHPEETEEFDPVWRDLNLLPQHIEKLVAPNVILEIASERGVWSESNPKRLEELRFLPS
jgi:hypothetical protein